MRQSAATEDWAGTGVPVNVVAPGIVETEESPEESLTDPDRLRLLSVALPQPLGLPGPAQAVADAISWLIGPENSFMAGQILFVDGGADAALRSDAPYREGVRYGPVALARMLGYSALSMLRSRRRR